MFNSRSYKKVFLSDHAIHPCMHVGIWNVRKQVRAVTHTHTCTHARTHTRTHARARTHTHTHTHTRY